MDGMELREAREELGLSRAELAEELGVSELQVGEWEISPRQVLAPFADIFELAIDALVASDWTRKTTAQMHEFLSPEATAARLAEDRAAHEKTWELVAGAQEDLGCRQSPGDTIHAGGCGGKLVESGKDFSRIYEILTCERCGKTVVVPRAESLVGAG